jgi:hypothetical protein
MFKNILNQIETNDTNWYCVVFDFTQINAGGIYITYEQFLDMDVAAFKDCQFRIYKKTQKIVVSGVSLPSGNFCVLNFKYQMWRCMLCKKINNINESKCFCESYSKCWTPLNGQIEGLIFTDQPNFSYHFCQESFSNLPL